MSNGGVSPATENETHPRKRRRRSRKNGAADGGVEGGNDDESSSRRPALTGEKTGSGIEKVKEKKKEIVEDKEKKGGKGKKKKCKGAPKAGEEGYLTPTQLRNRRKRRAKQERGAAADEGAEMFAVDDPSAAYLRDPKGAPVVREAADYFHTIQPSQWKDGGGDDNGGDLFPIRMGPTRNWRTVSKLAVRPDPTEGPDAVTIGLFAPNTREIVPVVRGGGCAAHHPAVDVAVERIVEACRTVGVKPYHEGEGSGQLRYVAVNVARGGCGDDNDDGVSEKGGVQLTLVWNGTPDDKEDTLESLLDELAAMASVEPTGHGGSSNRGAVALKDATIGGPPATSTAIATAGETTEGISPLPKLKRRRGRREVKDSKIISAPTVKIAGTPASSSSLKKARKFLNLHSLWVNYNPSSKHSNAIFDHDESRWRHVSGPRCIVERLNFDDSDGSASFFPSAATRSVRLHFPPNVFRQANLDAFSKIVGLIRARVMGYRRSGADEGGNDDDKNKNPPPSCVELYGGVGTIGMHLVDVVSNLVSSDENPHNARCFKDSVGLLPAEFRSRVSYITKNAADMVRTEAASLSAADVLVVDPPRKGLDAEVIEFLVGVQDSGPRLLAYVSCGFRAFRRDCDALLGSGLWKLERAEGHLLFPGSDAIETVAFFERQEI